MMKVAGKPISAATGAASAQQISMTMVRIIFGSFSCGRGTCVWAALRFAFQPGNAARPLMSSHLFEILYLVRDFPLAANLPLQFALPCAERANLDNHCVAGIEPRHLLLRLLTGRLALQFKNRIALLQASALGVAAGCNGYDGHGTVEIARCDEAHIGYGVWDNLHAQTDRAEKIVPQDFVSSSDVLREEPRKVGVANRFGGFANTYGIVEEPASLGIILIHPLQDF